MKPEILIVDNEREMARMISEHLSAEDYATTVTTSGAEAIACLERQSFVVVISDLIMDDVDGLMVLRESQRLQPASRVILMTAFGTLDNAISALRQGAYDYLTKPFSMIDQIGRAHV